MEYKKGSENKVVDALSRQNEEAGDKVGDDGREQCSTTLLVEPAWLEQVRAMIDQSPFFMELQNKADKGALSNSRYRRMNGIWFYKDRVLLDPTSELYQITFHDYHSAPSGGHSGYHMTLRRIKLPF